MRTWVPRLGAPLTALVILAVTLSPGAGGAAISPPWCLLCGDRVTADAVRNILLFLPLGVMLRLGGRSSRWVIGSAAILSLGIELAQFFIPGRDPSVADVLANTLGAALGAWAAGAPPDWLVPAPRRAARMAVCWLALILVMAGAGRLLLLPSLPDSTYYGQWAPQFGNMAWYGGSVRQARLGARALPDGPLDSSRVLRASLLAGDTLVIEAIAGPPSGALAPIFSIADDRSRGIVLVGAEGEDLVIRYRTRASWLRLDQPSVRVAGAFQPVRRGAEMVIRVSSFGPDLCAEVDGQRDCPGSSPLHGWAFVIPESWLGPGARRVAGGLWTALLLLPACYWAALALRRAR